MTLRLIDGYIVDVDESEPTATITRASDGATTSPRLIDGYETGSESRNVTHDLIGGGIAVSLVAPRPRRGELRMVYPSEAQAWAGFMMHQMPDLFTVTDLLVPEIDMTYVVSGTLSLALDEVTRAVWVLTVPYQEVSP